MNKTNRYFMLVSFILGSLLSTLITLAIVRPELARADSSTVIYACVAPDGTLRIVSASTTCHPDETALQWNQQGPAGPAGPAGPQGPAGSGGFATTNLTHTSWNTGPGAGGDFDYRNLTGLDFSGSSFEGFINGADFSGDNLSNTTYGTFNFNNINYSGAKFDGSTFICDGGTFDQYGDYVIVNSNFPNAQLTNVTMTAAAFGRDDFTYANFANSTVTNVTFSGSNFTNADFTNAHFTNVDFTGANLTGVITTGATWTNVKCPNGNLATSSGC